MINNLVEIFCEGLQKYSHASKPDFNFGLQTKTNKYTRQMTTTELYDYQPRYSSKIIEQRTPKPYVQKLKNMLYGTVSAKSLRQQPCTIKSGFIIDMAFKVDNQFQSKISAIVSAEFEGELSAKLFLSVLQDALLKSLVKNRTQLKKRKETRFRSPDLALTMPQAREILLSVCRDKLPNIALSTCYTYTGNFKANTYQAKRHHAGHNGYAEPDSASITKGLSNVNYQLKRSTELKNDYVVDAKDAKGKVCADIDPVQNMGKSWTKTSRMDHQFDQSRTKACTPMTHLF
ncbi:unnamed protein product [Mytilus edulis]|uniref:Uncharacterized protein n=1 Tax=Mytilus edulis TaxID=6550 RepID=A0A8S3RK83_MYTED|nr:unnamed protein product [Mytilus edulis]